jgi:hypothetical protein
VPGSGKWDLLWTKWRRGRFCLSTSVSSTKTVHSTNFSILTITRGRYNRPVVAGVPSGPSMDSTPQYSNKKINRNVIDTTSIFNIVDLLKLLKYYCSYMPIYLE